MKKYELIWSLLVAISGCLLVACSPKALLPVANLEKVKPLSEKKQLEKQLYFSEAMKSYEMRDWAAANTLFRKTIDLDPGCDACFYELANIYFRSGYLKEAVSLGRSALQLAPDNFWYHVQLAQFYAASQQYQESIAEYNYLLEKRPDMEDLYYDLATLYEQQEQLDSTLFVLDLVDRKFGFTEQSAGARFEVLKALGKHEEATNILARLTDEYPEARYYSLLGDQYGVQEQDSLAVQMYRKALALNPDYTPALMGEADFYRRNADFENYFGKLYNLYGNKAVETKYKVEYLSMVMQIPRFVQAFSPQMDTVFLALRTPPDTLTEPLYATYLLQVAKPDSAISILKNNLRNNPQNIEAWHHYLSIEYFANHWDTLGKYAGEAHLRFPKTVDFMTMKAVALSQTGREKEAITWLEKTIPLTENNPRQVMQTYAFLGDLYYSDKNSKKCYEYYEKALAIDSSNVVVLNNYAYFLSEENKDLDKAYVMSKRAIEAEPNNATYLDTFGWILYKMGKAIEAKAIFRHAMVYGGNESAVILDHYGDVLHALGDYDAANIYWDLSLQKEPNPEVAEKLNKVNK